jgi:hypothetical protein
LCGPLTPVPSLRPAESPNLGPSLLSDRGVERSTSREQELSSTNSSYADYRWGGHLCLSLNSVPAFGEIDKGIYSACCCNGLGTVKGTLYGKLAAELAVGYDNPMVQDGLNEPAPAKLYPEPLMSLGANARLWWSQKQAGREL